MKIYSVEFLKAKRESLSAKVWKATLARERAAKMLENLQKNKNLWNQFCAANGTSTDSDIGDWMA